MLSLCSRSTANNLHKFDIIEHTINNKMKKIYFSNIINEKENKYALIDAIIM